MSMSHEENMETTEWPVLTLLGPLHEASTTINVQQLETNDMIGPLSNFDYIN